MAELGVAAGTVIAGRYSIGRRIGTGGMGAVYEGLHIVTRRPCAIKLMLVHNADREEMRERFFRESRALAQIDSEYIVDVLDAGIDPDSHVPFLVMERLTGIDLGQLVMAAGALPPRDVLLYLWHTALALDKTHRASIVHRDLKASNLFLTQRDDGSPLVKVLDFGVAKMMRLDATSEGGTQSVGTPLYMAPEQFRGTGRVSPATDIYALGMLAYLLLVGKHYWREEREDCENPFAFATIAAKGPIEPASVRAARCGVSLDGAFDAWFRRATALRPDARFPTAIVAISELASTLGLELPSPLPSAAASSTRAVELARAREAQTISLGSGELDDSGVILSPALSFTDSELCVDRLPEPGEATEMPLSVTNASLSPPRRRRLVRLALTASALAAAMGIAVSTLAISGSPREPLAKGLSKTDALSRRLVSVSTQGLPSDPPLTPADLALASPEPPAKKPEHRRSLRMRPLDRARPVSAPAPKTAAPSAPEKSSSQDTATSPSKTGRELLYRRD